MDPRVGQTEPDRTPLAPDDPRQLSILDQLHDDQEAADGQVEP